MKITRLAIAAAFVMIGTTAAHQRASAKSIDGVRQGPGQQAPDGLPVYIPPPGSPPPTTAEWDAMNWEVKVEKASNYRCETKMVREWLRVLCFPYKNRTLHSVRTIQSHGYQAYTMAASGKAQVVVQVVKGKMYVARFTWNPDSRIRDLTVNWPSNAARPMIYFN